MSSNTAYRSAHRMLLRPACLKPQLVNSKQPKKRGYFLVRMHIYAYESISDWSVNIHEILTDLQLNSKLNSMSYLLRPYFIASINQLV